MEGCCPRGNLGRQYREQRALVEGRSSWGLRVLADTWLEQVGQQVLESI